MTRAAPDQTLADLDDTDRAVLLGLIFRSWPFADPPGAMPAGRLADLASRTARLAPFAARFHPAADDGRTRLRSEVLALFDILTLECPERDGCPA